ncbi:hypothetical protein Q73_11715 [Bacillus coahuilensis m2-6]|uniref:Uncharacterized protein n=1 Tax=Bacillus coahuilensis p1.1.43 TaxID=1150625 RepID=A0A147K654_9BACI|nr:hypothetical protein [Bacillus coahuilensis]KUP05310.1 hypothetical protein Q75_12315 [Bacillus coahuilensis p1.1.43]KUP06216.1 hypothetical protein Q73_11715 [Bacillus coahuilensis m2-6]
MIEMTKMLENWQVHNTLVHVVYVIPKVGRQNFSGRILNFSFLEENILFYNDDQKSVMSLTHHQIESIDPFE